MKFFSSINPLNDKIINSFDFHNDIQKNMKIEQSLKAQKEWKSFSIEERIEVLEKLNSILNKNKKMYAFSMASEMGKPISQGILEIEKCILLLNYYRMNIINLINQNFQSIDSSKKIVYSPLGIVLGIMPWNFPFWQVFRFIIPALLSGNSVL